VNQGRRLLLRAGEVGETLDKFPVTFTKLGTRVSKVLKMRSTRTWWEQNQKYRYLVGTKSKIQIPYGNKYPVGTNQKYNYPMGRNTWWEQDPGPDAFVLPAMQYGDPPLHRHL